MIRIEPYNASYQLAVVNLILHIQQVEFGVPVTLDDQPDLLTIETFYQVQRGNFWLAIAPDDTLVGTIALIDNGDHTATIRKMFVRADYRGRPFTVAHDLFETLEQWAIQHEFASLWLGTRDQLEAALRFYDKKGFFSLPKQALPPRFPIMEVDNVFMGKYLPTPPYRVRPGTLLDITGMLALQSRYLYIHLSEEERADGFVTTPFTAEQVEWVIKNEQGLFVAESGGHIVGYAFGASWTYWSQWPMFVFLINRLPEMDYPGHQLTVENSYQYGPICVDAHMRGSGVGEALFEAVRTSFRHRYPYGVTFINRVNERSTAFHTRKLDLQIIDRFEYNERGYWFLVFS